ncbi:hypothetical protein L798_09797 [Zootermopsis nevadensis]|uniref:Uncharacterized protein n=1 Tax=Zootermopsis nevadensis TaxID=136037 RepID=A0A067R197_ZOONE|nr:hypothetical protein L798_09797 [Zootermopsis nevadensis]
MDQPRAGGEREREREGEVQLKERRRIHDGRRQTDSVGHEKRGVKARTHDKICSWKTKSEWRATRDPLLATFKHKYRSKCMKLVWSGKSPQRTEPRLQSQLNPIQKHTKISFSIIQSFTSW